MTRPSYDRAIAILGLRGVAHNIDARGDDAGVTVLLVLPAAALASWRCPRLWGGAGLPRTFVDEKEKISLLLSLPPPTLAAAKTRPEP